MALPSVGTDEWNEIATDHFRNYIKVGKPRDQYFVKHPTLAHLRSKQMTKNGGLKWAWPIGDNSGPIGRSYLGAQGHTPQDVKTATMAEENVSFYAEPVVITHTDEIQAGGPGALFDLLEQKIETRKKAVTQYHSSTIWAASRASTTDAYSIPLAIPVSPSTDVAFNNLSGAAGKQTYWRNQTQTCTGSWGGDGIDKLDTMLNTIAQVGEQPHLLVTTKAVYGFMQKNGRGYLQANSDLRGSAAKQMLDLGIPVLNFNGIPVIHDSDCPSGKLFALNDDALQWVAQEGGDYTMMGDFQSTMITGVMASMCYIRLEGALCAFERRLLGQIDAITAA